MASIAMPSYVVGGESSCAALASTTEGLSGEVASALREVVVPLGLDHAYVLGRHRVFVDHGPLVGLRHHRVLLDHLQTTQQALHWGLMVVAHELSLYPHLVLRAHACLDRLREMIAPYHDLAHVGNSLDLRPSYHGSSEILEGPICRTLRCGCPSPQSGA